MADVFPGAKNLPAAGASAGAIADRAILSACPSTDIADSVATAHDAS